MLDYVDYTIEDNHHQGNGYDHLDGDWALFYKVASGFIRRVKPEDRQDFLHDLLLAMAKVKAKYQAIGKSLSEAGLIRVASYEVADYWRKWFKRVNGRECGQCSQVQRRKCRQEDSYRECPKAIRLESLDRLIEDGNGDGTELCEMIADDNAVDVVARLDARLTLQGYPHKFIKLAYKRYQGYPLDASEQRYYNRNHKKLQKTLF